MAHLQRKIKRMRGSYMSLFNISNFGCDVTLSKQGNRRLHFVRAVHPLPADRRCGLSSTCRRTEPRTWATCTQNLVKIARVVILAVRQTHRHTYSSQYLATAPAGEVIKVIRKFFGVLSLLSTVLSPLLKVPPYIGRVATLPCEISGTFSTNGVQSCVQWCGFLATLH